jgi:hypothetical protein
MGTAGQTTFGNPRAELQWNPAFRSMKSRIRYLCQGRTESRRTARMQIVPQPQSGSRILAMLIQYFGTAFKVPTHDCWSPIGGQSIPKCLVALVLLCWFRQWWGSVGCAPVIHLFVFKLHKVRFITPEKDHHRRTTAGSTPPPSPFPQNNLIYPKI